MRLRWLSLVLCAAALASDASATRLLFQPASGSFPDFGLLPQGYGSRVTSAVQDGFLYAPDGGTTPNVVTVFGPPAGMVELYSWSADFGDLQNVVIAREPVPFEMRLVADSGYVVRLDSFDMAGWPHLDFPAISSVSVENGYGDVLWSQTCVPIHGAVSGPQHTHFSFSGVAARALRIKFDATRDCQGLAVASDDVGIDNITFGQSATVDVPVAARPPDALELLASPNPSARDVTLALRLPRAAALTLGVYDLRGAEVARLADGATDAGEHVYRWDGSDGTGRRAAPGLYFAVASVEGRRLTRPIVLLR